MTQVVDKSVYRGNCMLCGMDLVLL